VDWIKEGGAMVSATGHLGDACVTRAEIFFARMDGETAGPRRNLFHRRDLLNWLTIVGVFDVGRTPDGERLAPSMYGFSV
jgi:hypothetical protein